MVSVVNGMHPFDVLIAASDMIAVDADAQNKNDGSSLIKTSWSNELKGTRLDARALKDSRVSNLKLLTSEEHNELVRLIAPYVVSNRRVEWLHVCESFQSKYCKYNKRQLQTYYSRHMRQSFVNLVGNDEGMTPDGSTKETNLSTPTMRSRTRPSYVSLSKNERSTLVQLVDSERYEDAKRTLHLTADKWKQVKTKFCEIYSIPETQFSDNKLRQDYMRMNRKRRVECEQDRVYKKML